MAIECGLQAHRNRRDDERHDDGLDEEFHDKRPFRHPRTAARREIEVNRPAGERETHAMEAATDVVCERGFARIVGKVAIDAACEQSYSGQNDRWRQRPPHVSFTVSGVGGA